MTFSRHPCAFATRSAYAAPRNGGQQRDAYQRVHRETQEADQPAKPQEIRSVIHEVSYQAGRLLPRYI